jgi:Ion transport protein
MFPKVKAKIIDYLQASERYSTRMLRMAKVVYVRFWNPRSCPAIMFYFEGLFKFTFLVFVAIVAYCYGTENEGDYIISQEALVRAESALAIFLFSAVIYELGQLHGSDWDWEGHFGDTWNRCDAANLALLTVWFVAWFSTGVGVFSYTYIRNITVCLSSIPLAFAQLQYLSQIKSLGQLVIAILRISTDLLNFMVIYFVSIIGFAITFLGLFFNNKSGQYHGAYKALMSLFGASLGGVAFVFDDNDPSGPNEVANDVGRATYIVFVTLIAIILLNVLIAIMSNTFQSVTEKAMEEWSFLKVPPSALFCLLPGPLTPLGVGFSSCGPFRVSWQILKYQESKHG